jgi:hypothetical protein
VRRHAVLLGLAALPLTGCAVIRDRVRVAVKGCVDVPYTPPTGIRFFARTLRSRHVRGPVVYVLAVAEGVDPHTIDRAIYVLPGRAGTAASIFAGLNYGAPFAAANRALQSIKSNDELARLVRAERDRLVSLAR